MAELSARDSKLIQYLNEAYGKEKQLETTLQEHIPMTDRAPYKRRLQQHLKETKGHSRDLERRIKKLGGKAEEISIPGGEAAAQAASAVQSVAQRAAAFAQGSLHAMRGASGSEKMLKNAKDELADEWHEIAGYNAIEALATAVGDGETAALAKRIRREEERMANFLERLIPQLAKGVATTEIPASERHPTGGRRARTARARTRAATASRSRSSASSRSRTAASRRSAARRSGSASSSS